MKPLILTGCCTPEFTRSASPTWSLIFPFASFGGPLQSPDELADYLGARKPAHRPGEHWSTFAARWGQSENRNHRDLGLADFCQHYETVELWFDTDPNAQLQLVWLLDHFRSHPKTLTRLKLRTH